MSLHHPLCVTRRHLRVLALLAGALLVLLFLVGYSGGEIRLEEPAAAGAAQWRGGE